MRNWSRCDSCHILTPGLAALRERRLLYLHALSCFRPPPELQGKGNFDRRAVTAAIAVAAGAWGSRGLRSLLTADQLPASETAVRYQMYHAFGLIITALLLL
jgi:hypothetical protein